MDTVLLIQIAIIILVSMVLQKLSLSLGAPSLLALLAVGLLCGNYGVIPIGYIGYPFAQRSCEAALIFIMFYGGVSEAVAYISGPDDARFGYIVRHEFGHSFGFLMDEYSKYSGAITNGQIESWQCCFAYGMWKNVDLVSDNTVKWAKFINDARYAGTGVGVYEGALYETGAWRSSPESIMNSTDSGFNAPSREAIYYKIHKLAYGKDWNYSFEDFVTYDLDNINADKARMSAPKDRTQQATSGFNREPVFKESIVTGPDGKERIKIEMN